MQTSTPTPSTIPALPALQAPSVLLLGPTGTGKTWSLSTLLESGLETFVISTEPNGIDSLIDACQQKKLDLSKLHYASIQPARAGMAGLLEMANKVSVMNFESLSKLAPSTGRQHAQWIELLKTLSDFKDQRGASYGPVDKFDSSRVLIIDSLSGLNTMAMDITVGDKLSAHVGEWGVAMGLLDKLILALTSGLKCTFVLVGHLEREFNEVTGQTTLMAATLGKKLAPRLPRFFSEVVLSTREGAKFGWSTTQTGVDLKQRALPLSDKLEPSFRPIVEAYRKRLEGAQ